MSAPLLVFPAAKLLIHLLTAQGYGYFRDELYYLACADHLAFGYVDQPPLSIFLLWLVRSLFGDSVFALRLLPAVAGAVTVWLVGLITRELGGRGFAQALAMLAAIAAPIYLGLDHVYSMNALDLVFWPLAALLLIRVLQEPSRNRWLLLGLVLGLGLQNKISILWLGFGILVGLLLTRQRRLLATPGPWLAGGVAFLVFLPHLVWQVLYDWPTLEFMARATGEKMAAKSAVPFLAEQIRVLNPTTLPIWLAGLVFLLAAKSVERFRPLALIWITVLLLLVLSGSSRASYLAAAYTWLFAAGAVFWEGLCERLRVPFGQLLRPALVAPVVVSGVVLAPMALPVLSVDNYVAYSQALGLAPSTDERKELAELPQFYADMHGWESIVETVASVFDTLSPEEQNVAAFFTGNYGEAGAIDLLGRKHGLPVAVSGHNNYWLWGPRGRTGEVVIGIGGSKEYLGEIFEEVELAARTDCGYCMPYENDQPVWVCRRPRTPIDELWPELKHFD
ncbi:MAG: glycosyltransferase family 39 protein [Thermoanaerobaculia bacterium]